MRVVRNAATAAVLMIALAAPAQAAFDQVEFTQLIDDGGDHPFAYHDFDTLSVGEPGDGTVVFRGTVGNIDQVPRDDATIMYFGFTTDAFILGGAFYDLQLATRNVGEAILPDACEKDAGANAIYCSWTYERIRAAPGMELTNIWGFIDGCAQRTGCLPMDTGPGSIANQGWNPASTPHSYLLVGCTLTAGCGLADVPAGPIFQNVSQLDVRHSFANATFDTYVFNFTANSTHGLADMQINGTGLANATLLDGNGTQVFNGTVASDVLELRNVTKGDWQLRLVYDGFAGNLTFAYRDGALLAPPTGAPQDASGADGNATGNGTLDAAPDDQESPWPALLLLVVLAIVALRRRR